MRNVDWLRDVRYEVIPTNTIEARVAESVPLEVTITVTASPTKGLGPTLDLAERLAERGYRVVPHLSARLVVDERHLKEIVDRLTTAGIDDVFVPAGDADPPAGRYDGTLPLLAELTALGRPFRHVGITGYPQSHPAIDDDIVVQAMWDKRAHATYIVSNLCFDAKALAAWVRRVRRRGVDLPIRIGLAGPVERTKLLSMAGKIGVAESARFLGKHLSWFARLATSYSPGRLLARVAADLSEPDLAVTGLHVFTFNQVAETERWRAELLRR
ncbi:MAG: 5,10-methylenetetrahydrofolate reductase [Actinophytocola sp.]|uniref:methylenetetrahydrofolate reductase n=1 Tax=Actinophytocola sp. TaxID=1872138 RepID=UPI001326D01B|nr:methylenetetrahydrofolate reductase [Actinophytocola sp.]MPZ85804.1 5,10-methylenetetrahydrofolate reductase [Actinophytocola sp.]